MSGQQETGLSVLRAGWLRLGPLNVNPTTRHAIRVAWASARTDSYRRTPRRDRPISGLLSSQHTYAVQVTSAHFTRLSPRATDTDANC